MPQPNQCGLAAGNLKQALMTVPLAMPMAVQAEVASRWVPTVGCAKASQDAVWMGALVAGKLRSFSKRYNPWIFFFNAQARSVREQQ